MKKIVWLMTLICFVLGGFIADARAAQAPVKISTCWMEDSPGFNIWYAKRMGWDKEEGLDIEMLLFNSGLAQMEALPSKAWQLGYSGTGGQLMGGIRYKIYVLAPIITDSLTQGIYVRPDSPVAQAKGQNPQYPNAYGSAETLKGATILYTSQSTSHYQVGKWLELYGLTTDDVKMVNMEQASIIPAFEKGIGDAICVWAPFTLAAESRGWHLAGNMGDTNANTLSALIGDKDWCDKNPELVAKFLRVYFRASQMLIEEGPSERIAKLHQQYMNEFAGMRMSLEENITDINIHPRLSFQDALALMDASKGEPVVEQYLNNFADFFVSLGRYTPAEVEKLHAAHIVTDKFMKMVELPIPGWK